MPKSVTRNRSVVRDEEVPWLDVSMNDPALVSPIQRYSSLLKPGQRHVDCHPIGAKMVCECSTGNVLHDDVRQPIVTLPDVMDHDNVRYVGEARCRPCLT
jgi:hypothetical protein